MKINTIYIIKNHINDKVYIGQSWEGGNVRFKKHLHALNSNDCPKLYNSIKKHGKEKFYVEEIVSSLSQIDADYLEAHFIREFNSIKNGYNIKEGGSTGLMSDETKKKISLAATGRVPSQETRQKLSIALMGRIISDETKQKMSIANTGKVLLDSTKKKLSEINSGENNPNFGKTRSEETRNKISTSNIGKHSYPGENNFFYGRHHSPESITKISETKKSNKIISDMERFYSKIIYCDPSKEENLKETINKEFKYFNKNFNDCTEVIIKNRIIREFLELQKENLSGREIARRLEIPNTTFRKLIKDFKESGTNDN